MKFAKIAFRRHFLPTGDGFFSFSIPENLIIEIGDLVLAPLRSKNLPGIVVEIFSQKPNFTTLEINEILQKNILKNWQIDLAKEISQENFFPLSKFLSFFLPQKVFAGKILYPKKTVIYLKNQNIDNNFKQKKTKKIGQKMKKILQILQKNGSTEINKLKEISNASKKSIENLEKINLISIRKEKIKLQKNPLPQIFFPQLSTMQKVVFEKLKITQKALFFGPTGSGKTFLLRKLAAKILKSGGSIFFLVPEIGISENFFNDFKKIFGEENCVIYNSKIADGQKAKYFWEIFLGQKKIIIGSRSALFLPFVDLKLIIIEEEHNWTLKNESSPRFSGWDITEKLAEKLGAKIIFSSATPRIETFFRAKNQDIDLIELTEKFKSVEQKMEIVNLQNEILAKNFSPISRKLLLEIKNTLKIDKKILLFLDRRGFFRVLHCRDCGEIWRCPKCSVSLVAHFFSEKSFLICHHCGRIFKIPKNCQNKKCGKKNLEFFGAGTARIEKILQQNFPDKKIIRIDQDSIRQKKSFQNFFTDFEFGKAEILVGTQMITKGFDFSKVGLIGILDADLGFSIPDFRAEEKVFQNLLQVIGRAGRRGGETKIILQTRYPQKKIFHDLKNSDFKNFFNREIKIRKKHFFPPFSQILKFTFWGKNRQIIFQKARLAEEILKKISTDFFATKEVKIFIAPALIPKKNNYYFVNLFLITKNPQKIFQKCPKNFFIGAKIDLNPINAVN